MKESKEVSELRQDPVSHDWVIISTGRAKRPESFKVAGRQNQETSIDICPFEDPQKHGNVKPVLIYHKKGSKDWTVQVFENKFPIVSGLTCGLEERRGLYLVQPKAGGHHEVVVFRDHWKSLAQMELDDICQIIQAYQERYENLKKEECANYILVIHNHGREAGASVSHPHSQILAIPFVPSDVRRSLAGSKEYYQERKRCVHCDILEWERREKTRIIFENDTMVVLVPYVPKFAFEIRIFPKKHETHFEDIDSVEIRDLAEALKVSLRKIYYGLDNISYNFFIHTSPAAQGEDYSYYHWHMEICPRTSTWGGFELGVGGDVIEINPDDAARYLRDIKI